LRNHTNVL